MTKETTVTVETPEEDIKSGDVTETAALAVATAEAAAGLAEAQAAKAQLEAAGAIEEAEEEMQWLKTELTAQREAIAALSQGQSQLQAEIQKRQQKIQEALESLSALISVKPEPAAENSPPAASLKKEGAEGRPEAEQNKTPETATKPSRLFL